MNPVGQLETKLTLDQAQELVQPNLMRALETEKSIHQLLDEMLGDLEEDSLCV